MPATEVVIMSQRVVTVTDILDGHVAVDIQCPDRIYANCYVTGPNAGIRASYD
jgi:hypothetical protein